MNWGYQQYGYSRGYNSYGANTWHQFNVPNLVGSAMALGIHAINNKVIGNDFYSCGWGNFGGFNGYNNYNPFDISTMPTGGFMGVPVGYSAPLYNTSPFSSSASTWGTPGGSGACKQNYNNSVDWSDWDKNVLTADQWLNWARRKAGVNRSSGSGSNYNFNNGSINNWSAKPTKSNGITYKKENMHTEATMPTAGQTKWDNQADKYSKYHHIFVEAGKKYNIDPKLLEAMALQESGFEEKALSYDKAHFGLMQISKNLAKWAKVDKKDIYDPEKNIFAGAKYLRHLLDKYNQNADWALAAYNWGEGNVDKHKAAGKKIKDITHPKGKVKDQTKDFVMRVLAYYNMYKKAQNGGWADVSRDELKLEPTTNSAIANKIVESAIKTVKDNSQSHKCFRNVKTALEPIFGFRFADGVVPAYEGAQYLEDLMYNGKLDDKNLEIEEVDVASESIQPGDILVYRNVPNSTDKNKRLYGHIGIYIGQPGHNGKQEASSVFHNKILDPAKYTGLKVFRVKEKPTT